MVYQKSHERGLEPGLDLSKQENNNKKSCKMSIGLFQDKQFWL